MKRGKFEEDRNQKWGCSADESSNTNASNDILKNTQNKKISNNIQRTVLLYLHDLVYLLAAVFLVFLLCFRIVTVSGSSMKQTLVHGDYLLLLSNTFYNSPQVGDIIVASKATYKDGEPIVKRVIAVEGQKVDIDFTAGIVYVDDIPLEEPYTNTPTNLYEGVDFPLIVEEGCVFVMGDNRNDSRDSRYPDIGLIDHREILGKAIFLFLPGLGEDGGEREFDRIGAFFSDAG